MKIEHIAMYVKDIDTSALFFEKYFGGKRNSKYTNEKTGFSSYFISFADGTKLELMHLPRLTESQNETRAYGYAHMAFSVGAKEAVDRLTDWLAADGYRIASRPRTTGDGHYESCIVDGDGNAIEIMV